VAHQRFEYEIESLAVARRKSYWVVEQFILHVAMQETAITAMSGFIPAEGETVLASGSDFVVTNLRVIQDKEKNIRWQLHALHIHSVTKAKVPHRIGRIQLDWQVTVSGGSLTEGYMMLWVRDEAEADALLAALAIASSNGYRRAPAADH
jgi:hypothetical protein